MSKSEPDWEKFRVNTLTDPPGTQLKKLFSFMETFLDWRATIHQQPSSGPSKVPTSKRKRSRRAA